MLALRETTEIHYKYVVPKSPTIATVEVAAGRRDVKRNREVQGPVQYRSN